MQLCLTALKPSWLHLEVLLSCLRKQTELTFRGTLVPITHLEAAIVLHILACKRAVAESRRNADAFQLFHIDVVAKLEVFSCSTDGDTGAV